MKTLILASASPARRQLLINAGIDPEVVVSGVDESKIHASDAASLCATLAGLKARTVASSGAPLPAGALVLGCDSVLEFDGAILGKPTDALDAVARWQAMRSRSGVLHTGHCLIDTATGKEAAATAATTVHFAAVTDDEIDAYVATREPLSVAGAFTIDGLGGAFVERLEGDHTNVIGLSLPLLRRLLLTLGTPLPSLWRPQR